MPQKKDEAEVQLALQALQNNPSCGEHYIVPCQTAQGHPTIFFAVGWKVSFHPTTQQQRPPTTQAQFLCLLARATGYEPSCCFLSNFPLTLQLSHRRFPIDLRIVEFHRPYVKPSAVLWVSVAQNRIPDSTVLWVSVA